MKNQDTDMQNKAAKKTILWYSLEDWDWKKNLATILGKCKCIWGFDVSTAGSLAVSLTMGTLIEFQVDSQTERQTAESSSLATADRVSRISSLMSLDPGENFMIAEPNINNLSSTIRIIIRQVRSTKKIPLLRVKIIFIWNKMQIY